MARPKKEKRESSFVTLRKKICSKGRKSYYLDIYKDGKRSYEFLSLYLLPETSRAAKIQNENTERAAIAIRNQRELEIIQGKGGITSESACGKILLLDWLASYQQLKADTGQSDGRAQSVAKLIYHVEAYKGKNTKLADVDENWCKGFISYLATAKSAKHTVNEKTLAHTTATLYFSILTAALNEAVRKKLIPSNPTRNLSREERKPIRADKSSRPYLSIEEVKKLMATDCRQPETKRAFLFACFTGLRISDIRNLQWANISKRNGGRFFVYYDAKDTRTVDHEIEQTGHFFTTKRGQGLCF